MGISTSIGSFTDTWIHFGCKLSSKLPTMVKNTAKTPIFGPQIPILDKIGENFTKNFFDSENLGIPKVNEKGNIYIYLG